MKLLRSMALIVPLVCIVLGCEIALAQQTQASAPPAPTATAADPRANQTAEPAAAGAATQAPAAVTLVGQTDSESGQSRRNENIQFNPVDNNAVVDTHSRVGTTATIVGEFQADRGYFAAEYGEPVVRPIHIVAQGGTGVHGNLDWTHGNSVFNARSFFQVGSVMPARDNVFGQNISLPLWKGATLSLSGSEDRNRGNVNGNVLIPLASERTALTADPAVAAIVQQILNDYPAGTPNRTDISPRAYNTNSVQSIDTNLASGRLQQDLNRKDKLLMRFSYTSQKVRAFQLVRSQNPDTFVKSQVAGITWNRAWSPRTTMDLSVGLDRQTALLVPGDSTVPNFSIGVITGLGGQPSIPIDRAIDSFQYAGAFRQTRGSHNLVAGAGLTRVRYDSDETEFSRPDFAFTNDFGRTSMDNLRMGAPSYLTVALGSTYRAFRNWNMLFFAGDRWRATRRLALSGTVRYEPWTRPYDVTGKSHLPYRSDLNNVGGSLGFAYLLPGDWGVVRGAYGLMYGQVMPVTYGQDRMNVPYHIAMVLYAPNMTNPLAGLDVQNPGSNIRANWVELSPNLCTPYSVQRNFSWEKSLQGGWHLQLGYVGSRSLKLIETFLLNRAQYVPGVAFNSSTLNIRRPDQQHYDHILIENGSQSWYDAGRISLIAPHWHGFSLNISYWQSKSMDLGASYTNTAAGPDARGSTPAQTQSDAHHDLKALSDFDQPHSFMAQGAYEIPRFASLGWAGKILGGWTVSAIQLVKSGTPFSVISGSDAPGFGNSDGDKGDRPMLLSPSMLGRTIGNPDTSQQLLPFPGFRFINAPAEMAGNLGRNTFRKCKIANMNASLSRSWTLSSAWRMTLRAEYINLFNTPQFAAPDNSLADSNFGQITNTLNDGRALRFGLKFGF